MVSWQDRKHGINALMRTGVCYSPRSKSQKRGSRLRYGSGTEVDLDRLSYLICFSYDQDMQYPIDHGFMEHHRPSSL